VVQQKGLRVVLSATLLVRRRRIRRSLSALALALVASSVAAALTPEPGPGAAWALIRSVRVTQLALPAPVVIVSPRFQALWQSDGPPVCESEGSAAPALLRQGCPTVAPDIALEGAAELNACSIEGLECLYPAEGACRSRFECIYGLLSYVEDSCPEGEPGDARPLRGEGQCEPLLPVADSPCSAAGLACGYLPCELGGAPSREAECRCGRWYVTHNDCPID
jgi:hypothetical protein